jgi:hypothetical protein
MSASLASSIAFREALPEGSLRQLALNFKMEKLVEAHRDQYVEAIRGARKWMAVLSPDTDAGPSSWVLRSVVAVVVDQEADFEKHVTDHGGADKLATPGERERLALAAAGTIVALCAGIRND